jgi:peptide/nickel transport system substrate-binding protein
MSNMRTRGRRPRGILLTAVAVLLALWVTACGDSGDTGSSSAPSTTAAQSDVCTADRAGGSVTMASYSEVRGIDPIFGGGGSSGSTEVAQVYDELLRYNPDTGTFDPWVAEGVTQGADAADWTLKLRPGVKFSNGDPLTAAAVKSSIERHQAEANKSYVRGLTLLIAQMDVVDDLTLHFKLSSPWGQFPYLLAGPAGMIVNPKALAAAPDATSFAKNPVGAGVGPYVVDKFNPGEALVLKARSDYWGGPVCIQELRFVTGQAAPVEGLKTGQLDVAFLRDAKLSASAKDAGMNTISTWNGAGEVLVMNNGVKGATPPTSDVRVRQAVAYALDPKVIDQRANDGKGMPASGLVAPNSRYYTPGAAGPAYDPTKARQLVDQVKAEKGWDGSIRLLCDNSPTRSQIGLAIKTQLEAAGFKVNATTNVTVTQLVQQVITTADYDLACWGYNVHDQSPWAKLDKHIASTGGANVLGLKSPEIDQALTKLRAATTDEQTKTALADLQQVWNRLMPAAPFAASDEMIAYQPKLHGVLGTEESMVLFAKAWKAK